MATASTLKTWQPDRLAKKKNKANKTWLFLLVLAVPWIVLLITATGIQNHTWYLVGMGGLGIIQNVVVAGAVREPKSQGIPLDPVSVIGDDSVMQTLFKVEEAHPGIGSRLRDEFFQGKLTEEEIARWDELEKRGTGESS